MSWCGKRRLNDPDLQDGMVINLPAEMRIMENACVEINESGSTDWEYQTAKMASDPAPSPALKCALAEAVGQDPVDAVKSAETVYQILLPRALAEPSSEWKWRSQPTYCWVCNSHNTRLFGAPGYGVVHECLDCSDQFLSDGAIEWAS